LTGDTARLSIDLAQWSAAMIPEMLRVGAAAICFLSGATLAGFVIHHPNLDVSRPYGRTVTSIGILLLLSYFLLGRWPIASIALAAFGCGLQNALASHYRGIVLRTTHVTGLFTDFGVTLGMRLRGHAIPLWKIGVPFYLIVAFFLGGLSAALVHHAGINPIALAGIAYVAAGLAWTTWKHSRRGGQPF
ncbi:MAG: YoaK family protein, partial [Kiritimatiellia bacterium]